MKFILAKVFLFLLLNISLADIYTNTVQTGTSSWQNNRVVSKVAFSDIVLREILKKEFSILEKEINNEGVQALSENLNEQWMFWFGFQNAVLLKLQLVYEWGIFVGVYPVDFHKKYSDNSLITSFKRSVLSEKELYKALSVKNKEMIALINKIEKKALSLACSDKVNIKNLFDKRNKTWDASKKEIKSKIGILPRLMENSHSLQELLIIEEELVYEGFKFNSKRKIENIKNALESQERFNKCMGEIIIENMGTFQFELDELLKLCIKRAVILGEINIRKWEKKYKEQKVLDLKTRRKEGV